MSKEKQIEEMALDINRVASFGLEMSANLAEDLYELDYRKASEVAREIFEEIDKLHIHISSPYDANRYVELKKKYTEEGK